MTEWRKLKKTAKNENRKPTKWAGKIEVVNGVNRLATKGKKYYRLYRQNAKILLLNSPQKFTETMFLDTVVYKGTRFKEKVFLDVKTTETFQHTFSPLSPRICPKSLKKVFQNSKERLMVDDGQKPGTNPI